MDIGVTFIGDSHFENDYLCEQFSLYVNKTYIHVGDFNIGLYPYFEERKILSELNDILEKNNSILYIIRGNHDDPNYFNMNEVELIHYLKHVKNGFFNYNKKLDKHVKINAEEYAHFLHNLSSIKLVKDYTILNINERNILCVGGAISIDRSLNIKNFREGIKYYKNEAFNLELDLLSNMRNIDIVVTHNSPSFIFPTEIEDWIYDWVYYDAHLIYDLREERDKIEKMYDILALNNNISWWVYGHFHKTSYTVVENTAFRCLSILEYLHL